VQAILRTAVRRTSDKVTAGHRADAIHPPWRNLVRRTNEQATKGHIPKALTKVKDKRVNALTKLTETRVNALTKVKDIRVNALTKVTDTRVNALTKVKDKRAKDTRIMILKKKGTKRRSEEPTIDTTSTPTLGRIPTKIEDILPPLPDLGVST